MAKRSLDDDTRRKVADIIREELGRRGVNQSWLISSLPASFQSTATKFFAENGSGSHETLRKIERFLEFDTLLGNKTINSSKPEKGGYNRSEVKKYEGYYIFIYPTHDDAACITSHLLQMRWSDKRDCLVFGGMDDGFEGRKTVSEVSIPKQGNHISFNFNIGEYTAGYSALGIVSRVMTSENRNMYGLMLTLGLRRAYDYVPMSMPIALLGVESKNKDSYAIHIVKPDSKNYAEYKSALNSVFDKEIAISRFRIE